jgi:TolB-like protein/tetratricopeptide (TPR) repeat protein
MSIFTELRRRNVIRVAIAYLVTAWLVAQVAELALESFGTPDWVMKTLLFMLAIGLPFVLIFAWAFELTPEGIKREKDVDRSQSITQETGRKLTYTIIGILVVALVLSIATRGVRFGDEDPVQQPEAVANAQKSIAVLPFVNMSDDPDNEYFSDGISEELLNVLVKVEGLRVASRTSSFSFKGKDTSIPDIADALQVEHVLEGSVRKAGDTVRITAQLIDVKTDSHLWSETYDRKYEDVFVIQDEISAHIVEALRVALGAGEVIETASRPTDNLEAYEDYLRGRHFWQRRGGDNIRKAIALFEKATAADPKFARAWSSLAAAHLTMPTYSGEPEDVHHPLALAYAEKALALDPSLAEPHAVSADLLRVQNRWSEAEQHYLKAIELEPGNATGYLWYSEHLASVGKLELCLENALVALELDPFNAGSNSMVAFGHEINGNKDLARKQQQVAWDLGHPGAIYVMIESEIMNGSTERAMQLIEDNADFLSADDRTWFAALADAVSHPEKVEAYLEYVTGHPLSEPHFVALDNILFGRVDRGVEILLDNPTRGNDWMDLWLPETKLLREHPQFQDLLENAGLIAYWDEYGWPPQCSRDGETVTCH